jgi:hypothetical protein
MNQELTDFLVQGFGFAALVTVVVMFVVAVSHFAVWFNGLFG